MYQGSSSTAASITTSSSQVLPRVLGSMKRTQLIITNTSLAAVATIMKTNVAVVANQGIVLQPNASYVESTDGGYECWQGQVQAVADAAGTLAIVESFVDNNGDY